MTIDKMSEDEFVEKFAKLCKPLIYKENKMLFIISDFILGFKSCMLMQNQRFPKWWNFRSDNYHVYLCQKINTRIKELSRIDLKPRLCLVK